MRCPDSRRTGHEEEHKQLVETALAINIRGWRLWQWANKGCLGWWAGIEFPGGWPDGQCPLAVPPLYLVFVTNAAN